PDPPVADRLAGTIDAADAAEIVVRRSDGLFAYHPAVVVDDAAGGGTDVRRGRGLLAGAAPPARPPAPRRGPRARHARAPRGRRGRPMRTCRWCSAPMVRG